jgi:hypothetical protein
VVLVVLVVLGSKVNLEVPDKQETQEVVVPVLPVELLERVALVHIGIHLEYLIQLQEQAQYLVDLVVSAVLVVLQVVDLDNQVFKVSGLTKQILE